MHKAVLVVLLPQLISRKKPTFSLLNMLYPVLKRCVIGTDWKVCNDLAVWISILARCSSRCFSRRKIPVLHSGLVSILSCVNSTPFWASSLFL